MKNIEIKEAYIVYSEDEDDWDDYYHVGMTIGNRSFDFQPYKLTVKYVPLSIYIFLVMLANFREEDPFGLVETERGFVVYRIKHEKQDLEFIQKYK